MAQIEPTIQLLESLPESSPELLLSHGVDPAQFHAGRVFRSAVETIRGKQAASQSAPREDFVAAILHAMQLRGLLTAYERTPPGTRWDFTARIAERPVREVALEVKGGEGNSLNISNRPEEVAEFVVWCHLDGSLKHAPGRSVLQIVGRLVADIVKAPKRIDALIIRDSLCGTAARPCPKCADGQYPEKGPAPDVFLFPSAGMRFGAQMHPKTHSRDTCIFPFLLLELFGVPAAETGRHVHEVDIRLYYDGSRPMREVRITQQGVEQFRHAAEVRLRP